MVDVKDSSDGLHVYVDGMFAGAISWWRGRVVFEASESCTLVHREDVEAIAGLMKKMEEGKP